MPPFRKRNNDELYNNYNYNNNNNNYYHKDERPPGNFYSKRVSFKAQSHPMGWVNKIIECFEQGKHGQHGHRGNVNMPVTDGKRIVARYNPMQARRGGHNTNSRNGEGNFSFRGRVLQESPFSWYKVTLCNGRKYSRLEILKALQNFIHPVNFVPIAVKLEEDDLTFFIDNYSAASEICKANLRFSMRDGWKIQIKVSAHMPYIDITPALKEKIKQVMSFHYDVKTRHLDLSKFYAKEGLNADGIFAPLNCLNVFQTVLEIIGESVPDVVTLDLSSNKIISTEHLSILKKFANKLKALSLRDNKINNLRDLSCLQGMKIENLNLENNPLCDKFEDQTTYVKEVRKIFKTVMLLDGLELPPPLSFDVEETQSEIPKSLGSFLCNIGGREFTQQFVEQFFAMYDDRQSRDALIEAYASAAQFSLSCFNLNGVTMQKYVFNSRNLKRVTKFEHRTKLLHVGKEEIVRFLNTLPKTKHDISTFTIDLLICKPEMISLCICGVFHEVETTSPMRAFSREFTLVPVGSGYSIINDMVSITDACKEVALSAIKPPLFPITTNSQQVELNVKSEMASTSEQNVAMNSSQDYELLKKREMVAALSMQTGMNLTWSEKCLVDTDWNFNNALFAFNKFHKSNQIPSEAFIKRE